MLIFIKICFLHILIIMKNFIKNNISIILTCVFILITAVLGSVFVNLGMNWFNSLKKPQEWIPNFLIPIVWTIIYLLFAIIFSIFVKNQKIDTKTIWLGIVNGILNVLWCLVFFSLNKLFLGIFVISFNFFFAVFLQVKLQYAKIWYSNILWIYPIWISIATFLNVALWILN